MIAGRRSLLLSVGFLTLAVFLTTSTARAQTPSHKILKGKGTTLTPEQIRQALAALGAGEGLNGELDPFQQMVKDYLLRNNPQLDPKTNPNFDNKQLDDVIRQLTSDKKLMEQLKQFSKQKQTDPGRPGQITPDELAKLFRAPDGKLPELPPDIKGFRPPIDPKRDLFVDPKVEPKLDPKVDPKVDPVDPKVDPVNPKVDPKDPAPPPQPLDNGNKNPEKPPIELDKNPFPEPEEATDPRTKSLQAFAALWERNIGPLSETPEVQRALFEAIGENGFDFDMKDEKGNSIWDLLKNGDGSGSDFSDFFRGSNGGGTGWSFGNWELPKIGDWFRGSPPSTGTSPSWLGSNTSTPRPSVPSASWGFSGVSFGGTWLPFVLLLFAIMAVFLWLYLKQMRDRTSSLVSAGAGLGPWPVDPRSINTREDVVKAFEYVSVLICGPSARNWTHGTIAAALADLATTHGDTAMMLARLYELARYAPLDEPLSRDELIEARKLVCTLAGVSY